MYNLNPNTRTARFYSWLWDTNVTKYKNMCPYFWKYILTILILPLPLLYKLAAAILPKSEKADKVIASIANSGVGRVTGSFFDWLFDHPKFWGAVGKTLKWAFFIFLGGAVLLMVIGLVILLITETMKTFATLGVCAIIIGVAILLIWLFAEKNLGTYLWAPFKFIGNMVYSTYKNMCPLVTWNED